MSAYPDGRGRVTDESLQIHHKSCDVFENSMNQHQLIEEVAPMGNDNSLNNPVPNFYRASAADFKKIPGSPIAYWISERSAEIFAIAKNIGDLGEPTHGIATGDNDRFLKLWFEVAESNIGFGCDNRKIAKETHRRWFPVNKGGKYRKWYGNNEYVIDWYDDGKILQTTKHTSGRIRATNFNLDKIFREGSTWSTISSNNLSMRYSPVGHIFESKGSTCFFDKRQDLFLTIGLS